MNVSNAKKMYTMRKIRALYMPVRCTLYETFCGFLQILRCSAPLFIKTIG
jgi:hypothetical protein